MLSKKARNFLSILLDLLHAQRDEIQIFTRILQAHKRRTTFFVKCLLLMVAKVCEFLCTNSYIIPTSNEGHISIDSFSENYSQSFPVPGMLMNENFSREKKKPCRISKSKCFPHKTERCQKVWVEAISLKAKSSCTYKTLIHSKPKRSLEGSY